MLRMDLIMWEDVGGICFFLHLIVLWRMFNLISEEWTIVDDRDLREEDICL